MSELTPEQSKAIIAGMLCQIVAEAEQRGRLAGWEEAREACKRAVCAGANTDMSTHSSLYRFGILDAVKAIADLTPETPDTKASKTP